MRQQPTRVKQHRRAHKASCFMCSDGLGTNLKLVRGTPRWVCSPCVEKLDL